MKKLIFLSPVFKDYIWGGTKLKEELKKETTYERVAESWEISANQNGNCRIINEEFNGITLDDLFKNKNLKETIFGKRCINMDEFPLLIKFIDANDNLSIQVHPDDVFAKKNGYLNGKSEMWYIMDCGKNTQLIGGLNNIFNRDQLRNAINTNIKNFLNYIDVKKGDCVYIPAGVVHSILKDKLICEIQQNSDITYRVYDWDRLDKDGNPRKLHKKEAIDVIKTNVKPEIIHTNSYDIVQNIMCNEYFKVDKINCKDMFIDKSNENSFYSIVIVEGEGNIITNTQNVSLKKGVCFIIPASLGSYKIIGKIEFLKVTIV